MALTNNVKAKDRLFVPREKISEKYKRLTSMKICNCNELCLCKIARDILVT